MSRSAMEILETDSREQRYVQMVILGMLENEYGNVQQVEKLCMERGRVMEEARSACLNKLTLGVKGIQLQRLMTQPWQ